MTGDLWRDEMSLVLEDRLVAAHQNLVDPAAVSPDELCGCFYCLKIYRPGVFTPRDIELLQMFSPPGACLFCGIDSVICRASGEPITREFLSMIKRYRFSPAGNR